MTRHVRYEDLGVHPVINANATLTALGGSRMTESVLEAMHEAAGSFVDLFALQRAASDRIAALTRNDAALVTGGASAGLLISVLGAMTGTDYRELARLLERGARALERHEVVVHRAHRIPYDPVLTLAGARVVEIGNALQTHRWELESAIGMHTAAVLYVAGDHLSRGALKLDDVLEVSHARGIPVIVDAAAQLPPRENLWRFTRQGADLVLFSGGKELRGPQSTGLVVGSRSSVRACELHASPHQRFGRPAKVSKEEIMGLVTALEQWLDRDQEADVARVGRTTMQWVELFGDLAGATATYEAAGEAGRLVPRVLLQWNPDLGFNADDLGRELRRGDPPIDVARADRHAVWINAELLTSSEEHTVATRVPEVFQYLSRQQGNPS